MKSGREGGSTLPLARAPDRGGDATPPEWTPPRLWTPQEGYSIRILRLSLLLILACTAPATAPEPDTGARIGVPLGRSNHLRSGHFSYRLGSIERRGDELRVGLRLSNGTHRDYGDVLVRVILFGYGGAIHTIRLPVGPMRAEQTKPLVARIEDVTFRLQDVTLELIYALP